MLEESTLVLKVPGLVERPAVGTSCCVTSADALITGELWMLPGIIDTRIDAREGRVVVRYDPHRLSPEVILATLDEIGYAPSSASS